jgi:hypothetical protein
MLEEKWSKMLVLSAERGLGIWDLSSSGASCWGKLSFLFRCDAEGAFPGDCLFASEIPDGVVSMDGCFSDNFVEI